MTLRFSFIWSAVLSWSILAALSAPFCYAQDASSADVVAKLRNSLDSYAQTLPDLLCNEHVESKKTSKGKVKNDIVLDSDIFVQHADNTNPSGNFKEVRSVRTINGKAHS